MVCGYGVMETLEEIVIEIETIVIYTQITTMVTVNKIQLLTVIIKMDTKCATK